MQKRIAAIHDLSCFGKCSLTVALPVISALGVECAVVPTALLSGHFAALPEVSVQDLSGFMDVVADHWERGGVRLDGIYSGYLSSPAQAEQVLRFVERFRGEGTIYVHDPAMADRGKLYRGFGPEQVEAMRRLCAVADVTVPNVTEACMMLGCEYREVQDRAMVDKLTDGLLDLGAKTAVITGVSVEEGRVGVACRGREKALIDQPRVPGHYCGTGDLFASVLTACLVRGDSLLSAAERALNFTGHVIAETAKNPHRRPYGVDFEQCLPLLWKEGLDDICFGG